jgi:hypothetical protein
MFISILSDVELDYVTGGNGTTQTPPANPTPTTTQTPGGTVVTCPAGSTLSIKIEGNQVTATCVPDK